MELKIYNHGAHIQGEMNDSEFHSHDCIQISQASKDSVISFHNEDVPLESGKVIVIAHKVQHKIQSSNWINILVDNECVIGEELCHLIGDKKYLVTNEYGLFQRIFDSPEAELSQMNQSIREEVKKAISLVGEHDHNCDLNEVAAQVALSPDRFRKVFKEEIGITFKNYLRW